MASNTDLYRTARDQLVDLIGDYEKAVDAFAWPQLRGTFNWALDWFDDIARDNDRTALWIVEEDGAETRISFRQIAERSSRVANWLRAQGVAAGDRVLLMLGNQVEQWETVLAAMKLRAVFIPAT